MKNLSFTLLLAVLLLSGCHASTPAVDVAKEEATLRSLDDQWSAAAGRKDVDAVVSYYAPDAVVLGADQPMHEDKASIRASWTGLLGVATSISWKASKVEVAQSGDLASVYGHYQLALANPAGGPAINAPGKFSEVWKKQADGSWKCIVDTFSGDAAAK